jgi:hypothetical protein
MVLSRVDVHLVVLIHGLWGKSMGLGLVRL